MNGLMTHGDNADCVLTAVVEVGVNPCSFCPGGFLKTRLVTVFLHFRRKGV